MNSTKTHIIDLDADPFVPEGTQRFWVGEHRKGGQFTWSPETVELLGIQKRLTHGYRESEYGSRLYGELVLNANVLDYLLAHQHLIPNEWKDKRVYFWGTLYRDRGQGDWCARCLYWNEKMGCWDWSFNWLQNKGDFCEHALIRRSV